VAIQIRSTQQSISARALVGLQGNISRLGTLQEQLSSGKQISRPSDSPTGAVSAMQIRSEIRTAEQHMRNATDGMGWLGTIDNTLSTMSSQLTRARDLAIQGASSGSVNMPGAREALASEVRNIRQSLISAANTTYLDRPVFGGTTNKEAAYTGGAVFQGDPGTTVARTIGDGPPIRVDITGPEVFGTAPNDLFTVLDRLATNLENQDTVAISADIDALDGVFSTIKTTVSDIGARYNRLEIARTTAEDKILALRTQLSDVEDIDLPATIMQLQMQQVAYEAALAATAKAIQPSLMDFLR
jgi:flagellar hook-associated protein 3 FlgL